MSEHTAVSSARIRVLPPEEARKIAAGEVIDRPAALIREFIDNAIDAGGTEIEVSIEGGGAKRAEVTDNGEGMDREDLAACWLTHATSKIRSLKDLDTARSLGFRGEALAAAAAVAGLEILSSTGGREAWQLSVGPGGAFPDIHQGMRTKGTSVRALGLFDSIPARKRFLKREGTEANLCKQAFLDKAVAFPGITFRFYQEGRLVCFLPGTASLKERFAAALLNEREAGFLHEIDTAGEGFRAGIVAGGPELYRGDRRLQYIFANGRRIQDFSLQQALEYGLQGWFPNGTHPVGAVYVTVEPHLADFNIHPAKREVRFSNAGMIHHAITETLLNFARHGSLKTRERGEPVSLFAFHERNEESFSAKLAMEALLENPPVFASPPGPAPHRETPRPGTESGCGVEQKGGLAAEKAPFYPIKLAGRLFGLFILVEAGDTLYIIDQHAAHERILFDRFMVEPSPAQELLVPIPFDTESEEDDRFLESKTAELKNLGIRITRKDESWSIEALPAGWGLGDSETVRKLKELKNSGENAARRWAATCCCRGAIKDGDWLDDKTALELAETALALSDPHCPHGRPVWTEIRREALLKAVKRT
ncbi:MAG: DNA mismatch repair endonuclease MutL [Treponema sp.]|jgi:DNA mismatch repair protein MutL|nr:DNA mismatch repair endonuclease MutL [Treponema sp.]